jgi:hypothetical protein
MENDVTDETKKQPTGDYEVGYARTPKETRWRKGECPNPRGRKPKPKANGWATFVELLRKEFGKEVAVTEGGKDVKLPLRELVAQMLVRDLVNATAAQRLRTLQILQNLGVLDPSPGDQCFDEEEVHKFVEQLAKEARRSEELERQFPRR